MPITADCHLHSSFSGDSKTTMEEMILLGIRQGLSTICFTEHNDFDYPEYPDLPHDYFLLNTDSYLYDLIRFREKYRDRIRLLFGVELGLQPQTAKANAVFAKSHEYDFIIGSSHVCHGKDPYYPGFFEKQGRDAAIGEYFTSILENIRSFSDFDVYGHLDYVVRYAPGKEEGYSYEKYRDILDRILQLLLEKEKGIELNTGGIKSGMREMHPCTEILRRYRQLGGEIITVGSDSHDTRYIASHFDRAAQLLTACGFRYFCIFEKRVPEFHKI